MSCHAKNLQESSFDVGTHTTSQRLAHKSKARKFWAVGVLNSSGKWAHTEANLVVSRPSMYPHKMLKTIRNGARSLMCPHTSAEKANTIDKIEITVTETLSTTSEPLVTLKSTAWS